MNGNPSDQIERAKEKLHDHLLLDQLQHPSLKCALCQYPKENRLFKGIAIGFVGALVVFRFIKRL